MIERVRYDATMEAKAKYVHKVLKELNPGIFPKWEDVFYSIANKIGQLQSMEELEDGMFVSSGMIRVQWNATRHKTDVLIDIGMNFP